MITYQSIAEARAGRNIPSKKTGHMPAQVWVVRHEGQQKIILGTVWLGPDQNYWPEPVVGWLKRMGIEILRTHELLTDEERAAKKAHEENTAEVHLSTRGWGDYSSVIWRGDMRRANTDILKEMRERLATATDVDHPNPTDTELLGELAKARRKAETRKNPPSEPTHGPGYCFSCKGYCYGDCGDFRPAYGSREFARDICRAAAECGEGRDQ